MFSWAAGAETFLVHQFSPCTNPLSTKRHSSSLFFSRKRLSAAALTLSRSLHHGRQARSRRPDITGLPAQKPSLFTNSPHARIHHPPRGTQVADAQLKHHSKDPYAQPSKPILFPKLRIYLADFPYLLCSIMGTDTGCE